MQDLQRAAVTSAILAKVGTQAATAARRDLAHELLHARAQKQRCPWDVSGLFNKIWNAPKHDSLAEWSKALASGASPQGRGFEPHSCHSFVSAVILSRYGCRAQQASA